MLHFLTLHLIIKHYADCRAAYTRVKNGMPLVPICCSNKVWLLFVYLYYILFNNFFCYQAIFFKDC